MLRYGAGEVEAFEELLRRHERAVFNYVARFVGERSTAEDLVQDVFLKVICAAGRYKPKAKFTTWLFTIARNRCIDRSRRGSRRPHLSLDRPLHKDGAEDSRRLVDHLADPTAKGAADQSLRSEFRARLQRALEQLPAAQREVFVMREFGGLAFRDIAEVTGVGENTAKSRMRYALEGLRLQLEDYRDVSLDAEEKRQRSMMT